MPSEAKKLALLRILEILQNETDVDHRLTHNQIAEILDIHYDIEIERKAVGRNISLLLEAGYDIVSTKQGVYLNERKYEPSEIRLLIDAVLSSQHIGIHHSKDLIDRLVNEENKYFKKNIKHIYAISDFNKTDNLNVFFAIDIIHEAIENNKMVQYDYNKYTPDKKLSKTSFQRISPYQLILHNQRYYLMGYSSYWNHLVYHRIDRITNISLSDKDLIPIRDIKGFENGINYKNLSTTMPYMYSDNPEYIEMYVTMKAIDHIIDWFGKDITINKTDNDNIFKVSLLSSPTAMLYWAMQYTDDVEIIKPISLREKIIESLNKALNKYK